MNAVCYTHCLRTECSVGVFQVVTSLYVFLWLFESFPLTMILCGVLGQLCHFVILSNFPFVAFSSIQFIFGVILVIVNHYLAFSYFSSTYHPFSEVHYTSEAQGIKTLIIKMFQVISYFTLYLWLVPFSLFVSLSANDNVLPTTAERSGNIKLNLLCKQSRNKLLLQMQMQFPVIYQKGTENMDC